MMQTYMTKKRAAAPASQGKRAEDISKSDILRMSGAGAPQPMSPALREKFEPGFNADFSNIRISRGRIPEEMGVQAVAKGTDILIDSRAGMDVLGHELAHVVQQAQGRVRGGFPVVHDPGLERQADVMGARAAAGLNAVEGGMAGFGGELMSIAPMSGAEAPAQCWSKKEKQRKRDEKALEKAKKENSANPRVQRQRAEIAEAAAARQRAQRRNEQMTIQRAAEEQAATAANPQAQLQRDEIQKEAERVTQMREAAKGSAHGFGVNMKMAHNADLSGGTDRMTIMGGISNDFGELFTEMVQDKGAWALMKEQIERAKAGGLAGEGGHAGLYALEDVYRNVYLPKAMDMGKGQNVPAKNNRAVMMGNMLSRMKQGYGKEYDDAWTGMEGEYAKGTMGQIMNFLRLFEKKKET